jgi:endonuclease YncB( thermonuclease family)
MAFTFPLMSVVDVHDGDTFTCIVDLGFCIMRKVVVRIDGVDAPEMAGVSKPAAIVVRDAVKTWLDRRLVPSRLISTSLDKYGRSLADVIGTGKPPSDRPEENSLRAFLLINGLAKAYKGDAKQPWTTEELAKILAWRPTPT